MEEDHTSNSSLTLLAAAPDDTSLPESLKKFYNAFKDHTPGEYTMGIGAGVDSMPFGPVTVTVDNTRVSVIYTEDYESATNKNLKFIILQGYAQLTVFDRFYASCILVGQASPVDTAGILGLVDHLTRSEKEREELEKKKIDEVKIHPSFFAGNYNDPINQAASTCGIYVIVDNADHTVSYNTVLQAVGIADFADNTAFGLAAAIRVNVNTFTSTMDFSVAGSLRLAGSERFTVAGEVGLKNGKLNTIGFYVKSKILIATEVYLTQAQFSVRGFQEPKIAVAFGGGAAFGSEVRIPEGLGVVKKALFPNLTKFHPLELSFNCEINPMRSYLSLTGKGVFMGNISVTASVCYDDGDWDAELKAATVRNNYLNGSLSVDYHKRKDNWNFHGNFNCSITVDFASFVGISVSGGVDLLFNSQDYTIANTRYNRKDLTISVSGMAKVKLLFSFNISVQKTWVFNLSNTQLSDPVLLVNAIAEGDSALLADSGSVLVCESEDIVENELPPLRVRSNVIEAKSWTIDEQCSASGIVRFQVAAEYTLVDTSWRLTHTDGDNITVYTAENSEGIVFFQEFTHNYYELHLDTPDAGNWILEITGDSGSSGGIYMDALRDEKFVTDLEILEQTAAAIRFRYTAHTGSGGDTTLVRLCAEEISGESGDNPFSGVIAYLEETENGEYLWEIPEEFCNNSRYKFYLSAASSDSATVTQSSSVEALLARQKADLECSWELFYSAGDTNTVTARITITNTGSESTPCLWQILDYTNNDSVEETDSNPDNTAPEAEIIASGVCTEIRGNSTLVFDQVIQITDELRDNPSFLQLAVTAAGGERSTEDESYADATDEITFAAMNSMYCQQQKVSWEAVAGAVSYVLNYALEGEWEENGVFINNIHGTSYTLSAAPGEYSYRVMAMGSNGEAIGSWSEEKEVDILFSDTQNLTVSAGLTSSRSQVFTLNDGIYLIDNSCSGNFTGTLTLYRNDLVKVGEAENSATLKQSESEILSLEFVNGLPEDPLAGILLDNGDYFWEWVRETGDTSGVSQLTVELSGEVFSMEQSDREIISIGDDTDQMPLTNGVYVETITGEVGFCNEDAIYQYMTDDGGEVTLAISSGTVFDAKLELNLYVQNASDGDFDCIRTLTVEAGEYTSDTVLLEKQVIKNNFYIRIASWDNGGGEYNTDYSFDVSFDAFEDSRQTEDILEVNGPALREWIGYRNEAHSYLLQADADGYYAVRLGGDAGDAILKVCEVNGNIIEEKQLQADGTAFIDGVFLERGNYFVVVESTDRGEGAFNTDYTLSASDLKTLYPQIDNSDDSWELVSQQSGSSFDTEIRNWLGPGDTADFFKFSLPQTSGQITSLRLTLDEATAREMETGKVELICCDAWGQTVTVSKLSSKEWSIDTRLANNELYIGFSQEQGSQGTDYSFKVTRECSESLFGSADGLRWTAVPGAAGYIVEYSADNFATLFSIETGSCGVDFFALPAGTWQWRVKALEGTFANGSPVTVTENTDPASLVSRPNGNTDLFFANKAGIWDSGFFAEHQISGEKAALAGLNRFSSSFAGSEDSATLLLTDDANGDALFADDIHTAQGGDLRLTQIDVILAGAGDDIVDLTSSRFETRDYGIRIYGGSGDDIIWSSSGGNTLSGGTGNDRITGGSGNDLLIGGSGDDLMHGGGGEDIFLFGSSWGSDTVEQSGNGAVTLWFERGSEENWDEESMTYSDGINSVTVTGVTTVTLKFGADPSLPEDAFADAASEKIFKEHLA